MKHNPKQQNRCQHQHQHQQYRSCTRINTPVSVVTRRRQRLLYDVACLLRCMFTWGQEADEEDSLREEDVERDGTVPKESRDVQKDKERVEHGLLFNGFDAKNTTVGSGGPMRARACCAPITLSVWVNELRSALTWFGRQQGDMKHTRQ